MAQLNIGLRHSRSLGDISWQAVLMWLLIAAVAVLCWWMVMEAVVVTAEVVVDLIEGGIEWIFVEFV